MKAEILVNNIDQIILTAVLCSFFIFLKKLIGHRVRRNKKLTDIDKSQRIKAFSNYLILLFLALVVALWFSHIQHFVISFFALSAAFVVATKELIMNFTGGFLIHLNNHFKIGDRIEVNSIRGFVIEKNFTTTKVLEIGPEKNSQQTTGDIIIIPNSIMLNQAVVNESYLKEYSIKTFLFKLPKNSSFESFEKKLLEWSMYICSDYLEDAKDVIERFCRTENIIIPKVDPRVRLVMSKDKDIEVLLKIPTKNDKVADLEQILYRKYVEEYVEKNVIENSDI